MKKFLYDTDIMLFLVEKKEINLGVIWIFTILVSIKSVPFTHQHRRFTKTLRLNYGLEGMKYIIQVYEGEINGHDRRKVYPPNTNTSLNSKCWNTYTILRRIWERRDDGKDILQRFPKPPSYEMMNPMVNLGSSLSKESTSSKIHPTYQNWWTELEVLP